MGQFGTIGGLWHPRSAQRDYAFDRISAGGEIDRFGVAAEPRLQRGRTKLVEMECRNDRHLLGIERGRFDRGSSARVLWTVGREHAREVLFGFGRDLVIGTVLPDSLCSMERLQAGLDANPRFGPKDQFAIFGWGMAEGAGRGDGTGWVELLGPSLDEFGRDFADPVGKV